MAWIPMRTDLEDDPAVIAIAATVGLPEDHVVGKLHRLWSWANEQTRNGNARGVTENWIDNKVRCAGFARAMSAQGWLSVTERGVSFPKFDSWNSQSAKERAVTARRVAKHRSRKSNATTVTRRVPTEENRRVLAAAAGGRPKRLTKSELADIPKVLGYGREFGLPDDRITNLRLTAYATKAITVGKAPGGLFEKMVRDLAEGRETELTVDQRRENERLYVAWESSRNGNHA